MRFASASALGMAMRIVVSGMAGSGSTPSCAAKTRHAHRPPAMPAGSPMSSAMAAIVVACHADGMPDLPPE